MDSDELKRRIELMNKNSYVYPKAFSKRDYIFTAIVALICLAFIVGGAFL